MKFLCLCYYDIDKFARLSEAEAAKIGPACHPYDALLRDTGKVVVVASLSEPQDWRTIRPVSGKPVVSTGTFTGESRQAGAFFIVDADNLDEAVAVASKHAAANYGEHLGFAVDVRPCNSYD